jgi:hypothetical protein
MDKLVKDGIKTLKNMKRKDLNLTDLWIHMKTSEGEILEVDIEIDSLTGEIEKEYVCFENEEDYDAYLNTETEEIPENVLLN